MTSSTSPLANAYTFSTCCVCRSRRYSVSNASPSRMPVRYTERLSELKRRGATVSSAKPSSSERSPLAVGLRLPADGQVGVLVASDREAHVVVVVQQQPRAAERRCVDLLLSAGVDVEPRDQRLRIRIVDPDVAEVAPRIFGDEDALGILLQRAQELGRRIARLALGEARVERALFGAIAVEHADAAAVTIDSEDFAGRRRPHVLALALRDRVDQPRRRHPVVLVDLAVFRHADGARPSSFP